LPSFLFGRVHDDPLYGRSLQKINECRREIKVLSYDTIDSRQESLMQ
jgi:hypothetical protein